jgi:hypothetical protein
MTSSDIFKQIQNELGTLLAVLEATEEHSQDLEVDAESDPHLCGLYENCYQVLEDLQSLKSHFESVGTQGQLTWERMGWRAEEMTDIRSRLTSYIGMFNLFNTNMIKYVVLNRPLTLR